MTQVAYEQTFQASVTTPMKTMTMVLEGEITQPDVADVVAMLERLAGQGAVRVVVDLHGVTHFDFRGVKALLGKADALRSMGGDLKLSGLSPYIHAIFRSAGAHDAFDYFATSEDAVASFENAVFIHGG